MISVYKFKPAFQRLLWPLMVAAHQLGLKANHITLSAIGLSAILGMALWHAPTLPLLYALIPIGLFLRMALNAVDGMMARHYQEQSSMGEVLNEFGDILSDLFLFVAMLNLPGIHALPLILFIALAIINETAGILAKAISGTRRYDGPMGKSDRALLLGLICIGLATGIPLSPWLNLIIYVASAMMILSTFFRLKYSLS